MKDLGVNLQFSLKMDVRTSLVLYVRSCVKGGLCNGGEN